MPFNERLVTDPGGEVKWGGFKWKPVPGTDGAWWFKWDPAPDGVFVKVHEDKIPDEFWVWLAKRSLLGEG